MADIAHHIDKKIVENGKDTVIWKTNAESLVRRLKSGDRKAAEELVDCFYREIYSYLRRLGHNCYVSEDLTQESFIHAWQYIYQLRDEKSLRSWLYRIASNVSSVYWRRNKHLNEADIQLLQISDEKENIAEKVSNVDEINNLQKAILELPYKIRQVIILHYLQQLTIEKAAEAMDIRQGTCKSRLNKGLKLLKIKLNN